MDGVYKIADRLIKISTSHGYTHKMCVDYRADGESVPDLAITVNERNIARERDNSEVKNAPDGYFESLAVYRAMADGLATHNCILFHGSAVAVDGEGYIFTAPSGTGKSTHTALWRELFGSRAVMVNDDKPLLRIENGGVTVYGTPWNGKHHISTNIGVPLKAVALLTRSEQNRIQKVEPYRAYIEILRQVHLPDNPEQAQKVLALVDGLMRSVPFYRLYCNMTVEAAQVAYNGMKG